MPMPRSSFEQDDEPHEKMKWPEILVVTALCIFGFLMTVAICSGQVRRYKDHRAKRRWEKSWPKPSLMDRQHQNSSEEELVGYYKQ
ncbi:hypothetical protein PG996_007596 [Apiospora saccharicola]|uniref:Uncharacterized protein n=1 Tax=Apiospora saccharicola TaxID=335842 RepID=A0ABR1VBA1_9PEZI